MKVGEQELALLSHRNYTVIIETLHMFDMICGRNLERL